MQNKKDEIKINYQSRLNKVYQFIDTNLDTKLSLQQVSEIASFSPFHFHRLFKLMTGETLNEYIVRRRIEKSVIDILHSDRSISEISHKHGFNDNSVYTKTFKKFYGVSPIKFKLQNPHLFSKIKPQLSKIGQEYPNIDEYVCIINNLKKWISMNTSIEVEQVSAKNYVFITCIGPKELPSAFQKLISWAQSAGQMNKESKLMTIYEDSLKITSEEKARYRACFLVNSETKSEFESSKINSGKYIVGRFEIILDDFEKAWTGLYLWMRENNFTRTDGESFEIYHNNFNEHPEKKAIVDLYIPIK